MICWSGVPSACEKSRSVTPDSTVTGPVGATTDSAIAAGILRGARATLAALVEESAKEMGRRDPGAPRPAIVLAGGAATAGWSAGVEADARETELVLDAILALAVGIVLGAGPLRESLGDQLAGQVEQLRTEQEQLRGESEDLTAQRDELASFITDIGPDLVAGSLDASTLTEVSAVLTEAQRDGRTLYVDMSGVTFIDSRGLGALREDPCGVLVQAAYQVARHVLKRHADAPLLNLTRISKYRYYYRHVLIMTSRGDPPCSFTKMASGEATPTSNKPRPTAAIGG